MKIFLSLILLFSSLSAEPVVCEELMQCAQGLPASGILKQNENGFVYVDIDDEYIHQLVHFLDGFEEPPYFDRPDSVGAHISVIYASERRDVADRLGERIEFRLKSCELVPIASILGVEAESIWLLLVDAPELDEIRERAGLPPIRGGMHIAIGIKHSLKRELCPEHESASPTS